MPRSALPLAAILMLTACAARPPELGPERPGYYARARCAISNALGNHCRDQKVHPGLVQAAAGWSSDAVKLSGEAPMHVEALRAGRTIPKAGLDVLAYRVEAIHQDGAIVATTDLLLVGRTPQVPEVVHTMQLVAANGEVASSMPQLARIGQVDGAGHYRLTSRYPLPPGSESGVYTLRTTVVVGGAQKVARETHLRVFP